MACDESMKIIQVVAAEGMVLCHDITRIVPGEFKGRAFRRGHVVRPEDIPTLLSLGKEHLYVFDPAEGLVHEDEAALRIARALAGPGVGLGEPGEGRVNLFANGPGLLKVNRRALLEVNSIPDVVVATLHGDRSVEQGRAVAGPQVEARPPVVASAVACRR